MSDLRGEWPADPSCVGTGLPLEGIKILDLSRVLAGPLATMVLGDLGADVIKVEQPQGDPVRHMAPPSVHGDATYFLAVNRNRRSVVADLRSEEGLEFVASLARRADAVVENFLPSQADALGISALRDELADVVWLTIAPASSGGPLADEPAFDLLAQARSGVMGVTGEPGGEPMKIGAPLADVVTGLYGAIGLLAALMERRARPGGAARRIEAPLLESMITALVNQASGYLATGVNPSRLGNEHPSIAPYAPFATNDAPILLAVGTEEQFRQLVDALGAPALADDERFRTNEARVRNRAELREALEVRLRSRSCQTWLEIFRTAGVPAAPVNDVAQAFAQPQVAEGDLVVDVEMPGGVVAMVASPLKVDGVRLPIRRRPPTLGEHGDEVAAALRGG